MIRAFLLIFILRTLVAASPPLLSTFFSSAAEESFSTYQMNGDGDLWPSCWADDGNLYTANGDGSAFTNSGMRFDLAVSRISGMPPQLSGTTLATNIGTNWSGHNYNRKPTGMLCLGHNIYLAFQNLNLRNFSDAPAASIARSTDHGATWIWNKAGPMFGMPAHPEAAEAYKFTTIFFLDYGRDSVHSPRGYVYAYGLDNNWREQTMLYLARIPKQHVQLRSAWQFYAGTSNGQPIWSADITAKAPVLADDRLLYPRILNKSGCEAAQPVLSQGGVVYDAPLHRYIYASWSCSTHEFFEAPEPWGPWRLFLSKDFGPLRLTENRGQYGTNIPSKFISSDGKTFYVQSNVCCGGNSYTYSLRKVYLEPYKISQPTNTSSEENLAVTGAGVRAISKSTHHGALCGVDCYDVLNNGNVNETEDDYDGEEKSLDWWGYTWSKSYTLNKIVYETGTVSSNGGWFSGNLKVQVRQNFRWIDVDGVSINPPYSFNESLQSHTVFTIRFHPTWGDGVRLIGNPGGSFHFTSIAELAVYNDAGDLVSDGGFEFQLGPGLSGLWRGEGHDPKGITRYEKNGHSGVSNAWIAGGSSSWNAITQDVPVKAGARYTATAWIRSNMPGLVGRFGARSAAGQGRIIEVAFVSHAQYTAVTFDCNSGNESSIELYIGLVGRSRAGTLEIDDVSLRQN